MTLSSFFASFPEMQLAEKSDNKKIIEFLDQFKNSEENKGIFYERKPDFFKLLKLHSPSHFVFLVVIEGKLSGLGSLVIRPGYIKQKLTTVGYLGDLRMVKTRRCAQVWRHFYSRLIREAREIPELGNCRHFFFPIVEENQIAKNSFQKTKKNDISHKKLIDYEMVNIAGRNPLKCFKWPACSNYKVEVHQTPNAKTIEFLSQLSIKKIFGFTYSPQKTCELKRQFCGWKENKFKLITLSKGSKIIAICGLWHPSPAKKIILQKEVFASRWVKYFAKAFYNIPEPGHELKPLYMTGLNFSEELDRREREKALHCLVQFIFKKGYMNGFHSLAFSDFSYWGLANYISKYFFTVRSPMALYQAYSEPEDALFEDDEIEFEMALV